MSSDSEDDGIIYSKIKEKMSAATRRMTPQMRKPSDSLMMTEDDVSEIEIAPDGTRIYNPKSVRSQSNSTFGIGSRSNSIYCSGSVNGGPQSVYGGTQSVYGGSRSVYGGSRSVYDGSRSVYGGRSAYSRSRPVFGGRSVYGGSRPVYGDYYGKRFDSRSHYDNRSLYLQREISPAPMPAIDITDTESLIMCLEETLENCVYPLQRLIQKAKSREHRLPNAMRGFQRGSQLNTDDSSENERFSTRSDLPMRFRKRPRYMMHPYARREDVYARETQSSRMGRPHLIDEPLMEPLVEPNLENISMQPLRPKPQLQEVDLCKLTCSAPIDISIKHDKVVAVKENIVAPNIDEPSNDHIFAKPKVLAGIKKQTAVLRENLNSKADSIKKNLSQSMVQPPLKVVNQTKRLSDVSEVPEIAENTMNDSSRPSFIKRKLFTQTLDVAMDQEGNEDSRSDSPIHNIYSSCPRSKAKNDKVPSQPKKSIFENAGIDVNMRNLIEHLVPQEKLNITTEQINKTTLKSSVNSNDSKVIKQTQENHYKKSEINIKKKDDVNEKTVETSGNKIFNKQTKQKLPKLNTSKNNTPKVNNLKDNDSSVPRRSARKCVKPSKYLDFSLESTPERRCKRNSTPEGPEAVRGNERQRSVSPTYTVSDLGSPKPVDKILDKCKEVEKTIARRSPRFNTAAGKNELDKKNVVNKVTKKKLSFGSKADADRSRIVTEEKIVARKSPRLVNKKKYNLNMTDSPLATNKPTDAKPAIAFTHTGRRVLAERPARSPRVRAKSDNVDTTRPGTRKQDKDNTEGVTKGASEKDSSKGDQIEKKGRKRLYDSFLEDTSDDDVTKESASKTVNSSVSQDTSADCRLNSSLRSRSLQRKCRISNSPKDNTEKVIRRQSLRSNKAIKNVNCDTKGKQKEKTETMDTFFEDSSDDCAPPPAKTTPLRPPSEKSAPLRPPPPIQKTENPLQSKPKKNATPKRIVKKSPQKVKTNQTLNNDKHVFKMPLTVGKVTAKKNQNKSLKLGRSLLSTSSVINKSKSGNSHNKSTLPSKILELIGSDWESESIRDITSQASFRRNGNSNKRSPAKSVRSEIVKPSRSLVDRAARNFNSSQARNFNSSQARERMDTHFGPGMSSLTVGVEPRFYRPSTSIRKTSAFDDNASVASAHSFRSFRSLNNKFNYSMLHFRR